LVDYPILAINRLNLTENSDSTCSIRAVNEPESILVFGATGSCGHAIVERGLDRGVRITAYVRDETKALSLFDSADSNLTLVVGNLSDRSRIFQLLSDHDAVISCLSSFETPHDKMSLLAETLVDFSKETDRTTLRCIVYSLCGVEEEGDWLSHAIQNALGFLSPGKFGPAIQDHKAVARILSSSSLDYTLFQTASMIDKPIGTPYYSGDPVDCPGVRLWDRWGVLDAADVCLNSLECSGLRRLQMRYLS